MNVTKEIVKLDLVGVQRTGQRRRIAISIGTPYAIRHGKGADFEFGPRSKAGPNCLKEGRDARAHDW